MQQNEPRVAVPALRKFLRQDVPRERCTAHVPARAQQAEGIEHARRVVSLIEMGERFEAVELDGRIEEVLRLLQGERLRLDGALLARLAPERLLLAEKSADEGLVHGDVVRRGELAERGVLQDGRILRGVRRIDPEERGDALPEPLLRVGDLPHEEIVK